MKRDTFRRAIALGVASSISVFAALANASGAAPAAAEDIRDIRGPMAITPWWQWPLAIVVAITLATAIVLGVRAWRARKQRALTPVGRARLALDRADTLARSGRSREWAELVAETMREALAAKLGTEILPQTTAEMRAAPWAIAASSSSGPPLDLAALFVLLETCDLARFAKATVEGHALLVSTDDARSLVEHLYAPVPKAPKTTKRSARSPAPSVAAAPPQHSPEQVIS